MPKRDDDLEARRRGIEGWLGTTGYPLEYAVAESFRNVGYLVEMGSRFDSEAGDRAVRETDVVAEEPTTRAKHEILTVVECKYAGRRPWVVRCQLPPAPVELVDDLIVHPEVRKPLRQHVDTVSEPPFFLLQPQLGFAVGEGPELDGGDRSNRRDRDQPFAALQSVVAAARATAGHKDRFDDPWLVWPVVVVDGELWRVTPSEGKPEVEPVSWQRVAWREAPRTQAALLDIVQKEAVVEYCVALRAATTWLAEWMPDLPFPTLIA